MTLAVRRVGQAVQQHDCADRSAVRLEHIGAIEVLRKMARINRAVREIPVQRRAILRVELVRHLGADGGKNLGFLGQIPVPVGGIELRDAQFVRNISVPPRQRGAALRDIDPDREKPDRDDREQEHRPPYRFDDLGPHGSCAYCGAGPSWQARGADQFGTSHFEQAPSARPRLMTHRSSRRRANPLRRGPPAAAKQNAAVGHSSRLQHRPVIRSPTCRPLRLCYRVWRQTASHAQRPD